MVTVVIGALVLGYGPLIVPSSVLGGGWIAAIGVSLLLSGLFFSERIGDRLDVTPGGRRRLSLAFAALAVVLAVAFVAVNGATFEAGEIEGSS
ncbi:hypothetical protein [Haloterrigena alkaliphila]|uniref:hypothetical protein n=1 Tax=Haloterrigena alkaliphila TaxID=2816475 RepID=UPI001CFF6523|nr:hypothetical protein [Haloterrigena alkaliphila]QSX01233.2 hypothetical protein J0X25_18265 [Haloterrigena alkaliphila]